MSEESVKDQARKEIFESLYLSNFCMHRIGLSLETKGSFYRYILQTFLFAVSFTTICYHVFSEIAYITITLNNSPRVEEVVPLLYNFGYGLLSIFKVLTIWYKLDVFAKLLTELVDIWPVPPLDQTAQKIKDGYFMINVLGVWFYNLTPIGIYLYERLQKQEAKIGFVWVSWYPFNKHHPVAHVFVYIFEMFAGQTCVWIMVCSDLLFTGMASHISMLLEILQLRVNTLGATPDGHYKHIINNIKLHQRLIRYCNDLEETFSPVNLVNIVLSSVNICCVLFVIVLLEPFMAVSNKLFLMSVLIQMGVICYYADKILHSNAHVGMAAYCSRWYQTEPKCRRALLFLITRQLIGIGPYNNGGLNAQCYMFDFSIFDIIQKGYILNTKPKRNRLQEMMFGTQKQVAFTAMGFKNLSLATYSSILTSSYSYFALLHSMYRESFSGN